ncbi:hypothetical protein QNN00_16905 [Bacillus velezensis]|nr:hypothetical protein [Bacillus velezensis]
MRQSDPQICDRLHKPKQGADTYLERGLKQERCHREQAGNIQLRLHNDDWSNYAKRRLFLFNQIRLKQRKITLYHQGKLIWEQNPIS